MTSTLGADIIRASDGSGPVEFPDGIIAGLINGIDVSGGFGSSGHDSFTILVAASGGNYTTLAAALAAVPAGGCRIQIKPGTYAGGVTISTAYTRIVGEGRDLVMIQSQLSNTPCFTVAANYVTIEELTIDGRRDEQTAGWTNASGVKVDQAQFVTIRRVRTFDTLGNGVFISGTGTDSNDGLIEDCRFENIATSGTVPTLQPVLEGVYALNGSARWRILNNYFTGWSQAVGLWYGAYDNVVAFNVCVANYGYYTGIAGGTRSAFEDFGETTGNGRNIWAYNYINGSTSCCIECAQGVIGSQFIGNYCLNYNGLADGTGGAMNIADGGATQRTSKIIVRDNTFVYNSTHPAGGISSTASHCLIEGNTFLNFVAGTIALNPYSAQSIGLRIIGNVFDGCAAAITLDNSHPGGTIISENVFNLPAAGSTQISIGSGDSDILSKNIFSFTGADFTGGTQAIAISSDAGDGHVLTDNQFLFPITTNAGVGINLARGRCVIERNKYFGGYIGFNLSGAACIGNTVKYNRFNMNNFNFGIRLLSSADYNIVQENYLEGISIVDSSGGAHNTVEPNHSATITKAATLKALGAKTVNSTQVTIAHGLGYAPTVVEIMMTSAGTAWKSAANDATNVYLTADADGRTAEVFVR